MESSRTKAEQSLKKVRRRTFAELESEPEKLPTCQGEITITTEKKRGHRYVKMILPPGLLDSAAPPVVELP